jgi:methyl-accepting chemotaxis protein
MPIELTEFTELFVNRTKIGETGRITVIEASGTVIAHVSKELILKTNIAKAEWARHLLTDSSGVIDYEFNGVKKIGYFIRSTQSSWVVLGSLPSSEAYAGIHQLERPLWIFSTLIILLAFGLIYGISHHTLKNVQNVIHVLTTASQEIEVAAQNVSATNHDLMQQNTSQASALTQTAESVEEVHSIVQLNSEKARDTTQMCSQGQQIASSGKKGVESMIQEIDNVNQSYQEVLSQLEEDNQHINGVLAMIQEIGQKTKIINDIVFQTRLLSFNASVEAARAGENGKGFAVVAEEVGNLAELSGKAAREIAEMLEKNTQSVETMQNQSKIKAESLIERGRKKVDSSIQIARQCGSDLDEIVQSITQISTTIENVSVSYQEQVRGIEQINQAMKLLSASTHENANTSKKASDISVQLSGNVNSLKEAMQLLIQDIQGDASRDS